MDLSQGINMSNVVSPGAIKIILLIVSVFVIGIALFLIIFLIYYFKSYNIIIEYWDRRRNINKIKKTKAKRIIEDGVPKLKIWLIKNPLKIPASGVVFNAGKRDKIFMTRDFSGKFRFVDWKISADDAISNLSEVKSESNLWESLQYKRNFERFKKKESFLEKYGAQIMNYGFIIVVLILLIVFFGKLGEVGDKFVAAASELAKSCLSQHI